MNKFDLTNKVAVVTGSTAGIGRASAKVLAQLGASVVVSGRREAEGNEAVKEITDAGGKATFVKADVSNPEEVKSLFEQAKKAYGKVDIVFLNSGIFNFHPIEDQPLDNLDRQIDVNIKGPYYGLQAASGYLQPGASVIINSSVAAVKGLPNGTAYALTKGAVNTLVRTTSIEWAKKGIRVNAVAPGPIWTEGAHAMTGSRENFDQAMGSMVPIGRAGEADEVAWAVAFLASDAASYVNGHVLSVDGGLAAS